MIDQDKMRALATRLREDYDFSLSITSTRYRDAVSRTPIEAADAIDLLLAEVEAIENSSTACCDSYAVENQRLSNEIDKLRAELEAAAAKSERFVCSARKQGTSGGNDPAECDWPTCGCDEHATKVIAALQECGHLKDPRELSMTVEDAMRIVMANWGDKDAIEHMFRANLMKPWPQSPVTNAQVAFTTWWNDQETDQGGWPMNEEAMFELWNIAWNAALAQRQGEGS